MKKFLFVLLVSIISLSSCTADQEIIEEKKKEKVILSATDPDDDGTFDPDPQETGIN